MQPFKDGQNIPLYNSHNLAEIHIAQSAEKNQGKVFSVEKYQKDVRNSYFFLGKISKIQRNSNFSYGNLPKFCNSSAREKLFRNEYYRIMENIHHC